MSLLDIAQARKGKARDSVGKAKAGVSQAGTKVEYGTATSASADGYVTIIMDNGGSSFTVPCDSPINQGDRVSYISHAGQGKAVSLYGTTALAQQAKDNADDAAQAASDAAQAASDASDEAQAAMDAIDQHFWTDTDGVHVTQGSVKDETITGKNILINTLGVILRNALAYLAQFTASGVTFFDGGGTSADHQTAQFTSTTARVGMLSQKHVTMNSTGISIADGDYTQARFNGGSIAFYDGTGNDAENITAQFGKAGAQVGSDASSRMQITDSALNFQNALGVNIATMGLSGKTVADTLTASGTIQATYNSSTDNAVMTKAVSLTLPASSVLIPSSYLYFSRYDNTTGQRYFYATNTSDITVASGASASGNMVGYGSSYLGNVGTYSISFSGTTVTITVTVPMNGGYPQYTPGSVDYSIFYETSGYDAPAFTFGTRSYTTKGAYSAAIGRSLRAVNDSVVAVGQFNLNYDGPLVVGNGTSDSARSNAMTVGWDGTVTLGTPLPVASGGTGATGVSSSTTGASVITVASGVTLQSATFRSWGKMAQVLIGVRVSSSLAANATVTIGTLASGMRPIMATQCGYISNDGYISTTGEIAVRNITGASIGTTTTIYTAATYLLA